LVSSEPVVYATVIGETYFTYLICPTIIGETYFIYLIYLPLSVKPISLT